MLKNSLLFLQISLRSTVNSLKKSENRRPLLYLSLSLAGAIFLLLSYFGFYRVLQAMMPIPDIGTVLVEKLISMVFLTFLFLLLFSNVIVAISTFYLSEDMNMLMAMPLRRNALFFSRYLKTALNSSWMVLVMGLPIFAAYARIYGSGAAGVFESVLVLMLFILITAAMGVTFTVLLMRIFPAKRTRDIFMILAVILICSLVVLVRYLQPEKLSNPGEQVVFAEFLLSLQAPTASYLPSYWASQAVLSLMLGKTGVALDYIYRLFLLGAVVFAALFSVSGCVFTRGWWNSAENQLLRYKKRFFDKLDLYRGLSFIKGKERDLMVKDIRVFVRDSTQWPQLVIILAIIVIYVINIYFIRMDRMPLNAYSKFIKEFFFIFIMGFAGFVVAAISARFVFSSISVEGRSFWIIKLAPVSLRQFLKEKFLLNFIPLFLLSEFLVILSVYFAKIDSVTCAVCMVMSFMFSICLTAMGVGFGAIFPKFDAVNTAEIAASYGGLIYMIFAVGYIIVSEMLLAYPMHLYYTGKLGKLFYLNIKTDYFWLALCLVTFVLVQAAAIVLPMRFGRKALERQEI
ncbi:MAG: hypothetical protein WCI43_02995 [Candidatus Firestonebacteria bacterium]